MARKRLETSATNDVLRAYLDSALILTGALEAKFAPLPSCRDEEVIERAATVGKPAGEGPANVAW